MADLYKYIAHFFADKLIFLIYDYRNLRAILFTKNLQSLFINGYRGTGFIYTIFKYYHGTHICMYNEKTNIIYAQKWINERFRHNIMDIIYK